MSTPYDTFKTAVLGSPFNADKKPSRQGTVQAFAEMQLQLEAAQSGAIVKATLDGLNNVSEVLGSSVMAWVTNDPDMTLNGIYENIGSASSPDFEKRIDLPNYVVTCINEGEGDANNIIVTTDLQINQENARTLIFLPIVETNLNPIVNVAINNNIFLTLKTATGDQILENSLIEGMVVAGYISNNEFRLISDIASTSIISQAEAARDEALDFKNQAAASAGLIGNKQTLRGFLGRDFAIIVSAGQSNAETFAEGGIWNTTALQLAWDYTSPNPSFVTSEQNTAPYRTLTPVRNHIGQHTGEFARALGVEKVYQIMCAFPGNSISQWVPNTQPNWIETNNRISDAIAEIEALEGFSSGSLAVDLMTWQQGESDDSALGSTFMQNTTDFRNQIENSPWWNESSVFVFGELVQKDSNGVRNPNARQNTCIKHLCAKQGDFFKFASSDNLFNNNDQIHFDGDDLRIMAQRMVNVWWSVLNGVPLETLQNNLSNDIINDNLNIDCGVNSFFKTIEDAFEFLSTRTITNEALVVVLLNQETYTLERLILSHPNLDRISIQGSDAFTLPVDADWTGDKATDIAKAKTTDWFSSRIVLTNQGIIFRNWLRQLRNVAIIDDGSANDGGLSAGKAYVFSGGVGGAGLQDCLIIGFEKGLSADGSGTGFNRDGGYVGIAHCSDDGVFNQGKSSSELTSVEIRHCVNGIEANDASCRFTSGTLIDCTNDIRVGKKGYVKVNGATYDSAKVNVSINTFNTTGTSRGSLVDASAGA